MEATIKEYEDVYNQPKELLMTSIHNFRRVMCSNKYTLEQKDNSYTALLQDYLRCKITKSEEMFFMATKREWEIRKSYLILEI